MEFDPEAIYENVKEAGEDWADKKSAFEAYEDNTKSVLADIICDYMDSKLTRAESEVRAQASQVYKTHVGEKIRARKDWLFAQVQYDSLKMLAELRRSQESTRRQEMRIL